MKITVRCSSDTRQRIRMLEKELQDIEYRMDTDMLSPDERVDLDIRRQELEDEINFAWQDDEAEWDYARRAQKFNSDGSLKYY